MLDTLSPFGTYRLSMYHWLFWYFLQSRKLPKKFRKNLLRKFKKQMLRPYDVNCEGILLRTYPSQNYDDRHIVRRKKLAEYIEHNFLKKHIRENLTFIDIGANIGSYSLFVAKSCGNNFNLLAFEPNKYVYEKLLFNLRLNKVNCKNVMNCGVGEVAGTKDLWLDGNNEGANSLVAGKAKQSQRVQIVPLLEVCQKKQIEKIDMLKIDIEGYEDKALAPFFQEAPKGLLPKIIIVEVAHRGEWQIDLLNLLVANGYKTILTTGNNKILAAEQQ